MTDVILKWYGDSDGQNIVKAVHTDVDAALAQAAAEPGKVFLGVFDGPGPDAAKLADVPAATN